MYEQNIHETCSQSRPKYGFYIPNNTKYAHRFERKFPFFHDPQIFHNAVHYILNSDLTLSYAYVPE